MTLTRSMDPNWLSNAYLVAGRDGGAAVIIDSGAPLAPLLHVLQERRLTLAAVLCTHKHPDHVAGNAELVQHTGATIFALRAEASFIPSAQPLDEGERRTWGDLTVRVIALGGHTAGQCGYLVEGVGLFTGDCLFKGSLGGTVGPDASGFADVRLAVERILALPDETTIYPGHADATTVGAERAQNPFIRVMTGVDPEGNGRCDVRGRPARLVVLARDYDGGTKAWVRFDDDDADALVPGSRVTVHAHARGESP